MSGIGKALVLIGLGAAPPVAAAVQTSPDVTIALDNATKTYRDKGYALAGWQQFGRLANAADQRLAMPLKGGRSYQIVAACDKKCTDLDLQLYDAEGKEVDYDAQDDSFPIVAVYARTDQTYTIRVVMSGCGKGPCAFGVRAFVKN